MDGRTFGASTASVAASGTQLDYLASLGVTVEPTQHLSKKQASAMIEEALAAQKAQPAASTQRSNRFAGKCAKCGGHVAEGEGLLGGQRGAWITTHKDGECPAAAPAAPVAAQSDAEGLDLTHIPSGTYAVPGSDSRLKVRIDNVDKPGKWNGWVFVKDGAEYGQQRRYGSQRPGGTYSGQIEAELAIIAADPRAAAAAYGAITGKCCCCGRQLEDADSVARGIGPVCAQKF